MRGHQPLAIDFSEHDENAPIDRRSPAESKKISVDMSFY